MNVIVLANEYTISCGIAGSKCKITREYKNGDGVETLEIFVKDYYDGLLCGPYNVPSSYVCVKE